MNSEEEIISVLSIFRSYTSQRMQNEQECSGEQQSGSKSGLQEIAFWSCIDYTLRHSRCGADDMSLLQLRSSAPTLQRLFTSIKNGLMPESDAEHGVLLDDPMHPERHLPTPATHLKRTPLKAGDPFRLAFCRCSCPLGALPFSAFVGSGLRTMRT